MPETIIAHAASIGPNVYDTPDGLRRLLEKEPGSVTAQPIASGTPRQVAVRNGWIRADGNPIPHDTLDLDAKALDYTLAVPAGDESAGEPNYTGVGNALMRVLGGRQDPPATFQANATGGNGLAWAVVNPTLTIRQSQTLGDLEDMLGVLASELAEEGEAGLAEALGNLRWFQRAADGEEAAGYEVLKIESDQPTERGEILVLPGWLVKTNVPSADGQVGTPQTHQEALDTLGLTMDTAQ